MTQTAQRTIAFSPPDITQAEIDRVAEALSSGWITTGPATKELEQKLLTLTGAGGLACLNSATACLEGALRILGIGPGDEVIVPAYTYTATAAVVCHVGATLVLCDVQPNSVQLDTHALEGAITERTKAIIPVDIAGIMENYDALEAVAQAKADLWHPVGELQQRFERVPIIADAAHSLGATYQGRPAGSVADITCFSFHAVKNFTTAEGGALAWRSGLFDDEELYRQIMLYSLHGQTKDALAKSKMGAWEYDIAYPGYKCNMTDVHAAIGLVQFDRYPDLLTKRRQLIEHYEENLRDLPVTLLEHYPSADQGSTPSISSGHLMITRVDGATPEQRNQIIELLAQQGVSANVHYKPLPMLSAYRNAGFDMDDYPNAYAFFASEITLPLHTGLTLDDVDYVCQAYARAIQECL